MPWLLRRLHAGFCHVKNPYGPQIQRISLLPEHVTGIVFWTRLGRPLLPHLDGLRSAGYDFYFFFTVNGYPRSIEVYNPSLKLQVSTFHELNERAPGRVFWRYDPIIISRQTSPEYHLRRFGEIARMLEGHTSRCYTSFAVWYRKTVSNLVSLDAGFEDPETAERRRLTASLGEIAGQRGIQLYSCCEDALVGPGVQKAHCSDAALFPLAKDARSAPLRAGCGCVHSADIGAYDTCLFGCRYCYATRRNDAARRARAAHDPGDSILFRPPHLAGRDLGD